jgi:hypothetical protein
MRWLVALVLAVAAGPGCARSPGTAKENPASQATRVPGEYLVTVAGHADGKAVADVYGRFGIEHTQDLGRGVYLVTLKEDPGLAKMEELRKQDARLQAVQPNFVYRGAK